MAKGTRGRRRMTSRQCRPTPYPLPSVDPNQKKCFNKCKKDWEDATCSVCMEYPHHAVLLLCSSHDKGCRPYMCGTSYRYSNCLDQYKKAYTKVKLLNQTQSLQSSINSPAPAPVPSPAPLSDWPAEKGEITELACPLCRGQVKGWTVVEPAREYLNAKKRSCMQDGCSFVGNFKETRKHVKTEHPSARPREMDPQLEQKWRRLEGERERDDVISTIRSSMPGAVVFGDYVIEGSPFGFGSEDEDGFEVDVMDHRNEGFGVGIDGSLINVLRFLQAFGSAGNIGSNRGSRRHGNRDTNHHASDEGTGGIIDHNRALVGGFDYSDDEDSDGSGNDVRDNGTSLVGRLRRHGHGRVLLGRSGRRRRRREAHGGGGGGGRA